MRRAQLVCDSPDSLQDETDYLNNVFSKNNYNTDFVRRNTHSNTDSNSQTNSGPEVSLLPAVCTLPMVPRGSSPVARLYLAKNEAPEEEAGSVRYWLFLHS